MNQRFHLADLEDARRNLPASRTNPANPRHLRTRDTKDAGMKSLPAAMSADLIVEAVLKKINR